MKYFKLPVFIYIYIKEYLTRLKPFKDKHDFIMILSIILTTILSIIPLMACIVLSVYKCIIDIILKQMYQEHYRGMMEGIDSVCCNQEKCVPSLWVFFDHKGSLEDLRTCVYNQLERTMQSKHQKPYYCRNSFMGYHYYYNDPRLKTTDLITVMKSDSEKSLSREEMVQKYIEYDNAGLPFDNKALMEVIICPQRVRLENHENELYCLIYRVHHCVADGRSLLHLFSGVFADYKSRPIFDIPQQNGNLRANSNLTLENLKKFLTDVRIKDFPFGLKDRNILRGYNLTEYKYLVWFSDNGTDYMEKIRKLRKTFKGVTFLDVINTCLASSFYDYYKKKSKTDSSPIPKKIIGGVVLSPEVASYASYGSKEFNLSNRFSAAIFYLPIDVENSSSGDSNNILLTRLKMLQREYETVKKSFDIQVNYWLLQNVMTLLPYHIFKWFTHNYIEMTVGISSLPGCDEFTFFEGHTIKELLLMPPNSPGTGIHAIIYTYKGQFRFGLTIDKSIIPNYEDGQELVNNAMKYLNELSALCDNGFQL